MQPPHLRLPLPLLLATLLACTLYVPAHASRDPTATVPGQQLPLPDKSVLRQGADQARPYHTAHPPRLSPSATLSTTVAPVLSPLGAASGAMRSVAISDTYALVRDYDGLTIFDVSGSSAPAQVAHLTLPPVELINPYLGRPPTIKVRNGIAYLLATHGFDIVDVRDPARPTRLGVYTYPISVQRSIIAPTSSFDLELAGNFVYLDGQQIVDVSDPISPTLQGTFNGGDHMTVVGDQAYSLFAPSHLLRIFDVHNPAAPALHGDYSYAGDASDTWNDFAVVGNRVYIAASNGQLGGALLIFDISDPLNITLRGRYAATVSLLDIALVGNLAYLRSGKGQMQIVDVGDPARPALRGQYDASAIDLAVGGTTAYAVMSAPTANGLAAIDASDPAHPTLRGRYNVLDDPIALAVVGNLAYLGDSAGLDILNASNPAHPAWAGHYDAAGSVKKIVVDTTIAYIVVVHATVDGEIQLVDVSDPAHPALRGRYPWPSYLYSARPGFAVGDGMLYLGKNGAGLEVVDVRDPAKPALRGHFNDAGASYQDVRVDGGKVYAAVNDELQIFDAHNSAALQRLARLKVGGTALALEIKGGLAYIVRSGSTSTNPPEPARLLLIDIHNPSTPAILGSTAIGLLDYNYRSVIGVADGLAYIANETLQIVDVHDPGHLAVYQTDLAADLAPHRPEDVQAVGNRVYLVANKDGLLVFQRASITTARVPPGGGTFSSHGGGISYAFAAGTFSTMVTVAITEELSSDLSSTGDLVVAGPVFEATATYSATGSLAEPTQPYSLTVRSTEAQRGPAIVPTLGLYYWDGARWVRAPGSMLDSVAWTITATPSHFSRWAVLGKTRQTYLPIVQRANV